MLPAARRARRVLRGVQLCAGVTLCFALEAEPRAGLWSRSAPLSVTPVAGLSGVAYGLGVVPLPDPPPQVAQASADGSVIPGCPLGVRAVVRGEGGAQTFAVLAVDGRSRVARAGEDLSVGGVTWRVEAIEAQRVVVGQGSERRSCALHAEEEVE